MNRTPQQMVTQYHSTAGLPVGEGRSDAQDALRHQLIMEESSEIDTAYWDNEPDTSLLKELADLVYVCYGAAVTYGWNLDEAVKRVHENNMGRMYQDDGSIKRREDGKIIKNTNFPKVDLEDLV